MKKRIVSTLLALCMLLCLMPTAAFAEESAETPPVCSCETACTAESMNTDCPVCGAEGALPENCAKCAQPADNAAAQPEAALTALSGEGVMPAAGEKVKEVRTADELTAAIADSSVNTVKLAGDISISSSLIITRTVTLDLNGHVLQMTGNDSDPVIEVKKDSNGVGIGNLALTDSDPDAVHTFTPNPDGLWVLDEENGTKTVNGGVITGSKEMGIWVDGGHHQAVTQKPAEADCAHLIMTGGNIVGCAAAAGGGVCAGFYAYFTMTGGSIRGCVAKAGGGVCLTNSASFAMGGSALIADCISTDGGSCGGGGIGADFGALVALSGNAVIQNCTAQLGGGVYLNNAALTMSENASVTGCNSIAGGGVSAYGDAMESDPPVFTMEGSSSITDCTALNGGGIFVSTNGGKVSLSGSAKIKNCHTVERDGLDFPNVTGGGVNVIRGSFEMSGGSIESCTAVNGGNSVFVFQGGGGKFTMTGGTVDGSITMPYTVGNDTVYMDGLGTAVSPYQISTAAQLKLFRDIVNGSNGQKQDPTACAVLMNDIVLNDGTFDANGTYTPGSSSKAAEEWTPIGKYTDDNDKTPYTGTFDGQGHTIKGLYVNSASDAYVGLFGCLEGAAVRNLTVDGYVQGYKTAGGIAGYASNAAIENCSNHCSVFGGSDSMLGGIAGLNFDGAKIIDCYNVGTIIRNSTVFEFCGGIVWGNAGTVSNCYNVGTISGNVYDGEIVGRNSGTVENCYYLAGTNLDAVGQSDSYGKTTKTESKTAAEFADGTLLELLKADRNDSPWDSCQYLAAAGKTLPVFKGQGDAHEHNGNWTSNGNGTHSRRCTCNAVETQNCSGGKATCKDKAICEICGDSYGSPEPNNHTDLKHIDAKAATAAEEGNIEYWHCGDCNKYFSDAAAKTEITRADTVTAKLPQPTTPPTATPTAALTTAPQAAEQPRRTAQPTVQPTAAPTVQPVSTIPATGDTSSPILWAALLLCGGAGLAVTAYKKNRHRS